MPRIPIIKKILIAPMVGLIYLYKYLISPLLPAACRHYPSCSSYALDALKLHGPVKGSLMAGNRILRCHPWGTSGFDPVPGFIFKKYHPGRNPFHRLIRYPRSNRLKRH